MEISPFYGSMNINNTDLSLYGFNSTNLTVGLNIYNLVTYLHTNVISNS